MMQFSALLCLFAQGPMPDDFRAYLAHVQEMVESAGDKDTMIFEMAKTWAAAKQWPQAMEWLRKVAALKVGLDPSRDRVFAELRGTREFEEIEAEVRAATPPVSHSRRAFTVSEGDLAPESMAYDSAGKRFYFGSMRKGKILKCSASGKCAQFAGGLGVVLGVKVHDGGLWILNNADAESALIHYELKSGRVVRKYAVTGAGHTFNDLVFAPAGDIYLTDTRAGAVWRLANREGELERMPGEFPSANGIALSGDGLLYVSTFGDGIRVVDLKTGAGAGLGHADDLCLGAVDGLYFYRGGLIGIQNGFMTPRVVRMFLGRDGRAVERFEVLERRNPLFEGVTTGVVVGDEFFYMANIQDEKRDGFRPIVILRVRL
jgi:sugar lactone lactonase YvrE